MCYAAQCIWPAVGNFAGPERGVTSFDLPNQNRISAIVGHYCASGRPMPRTITTSFRPDNYLIDMFDHIAGWKVYDGRGRDLYTTATLRAAVVYATAYLVLINGDVAIHRESDDGVVVFKEQIQRLMEGIS